MRPTTGLRRPTTSYPDPALDDETPPEGVRWIESESGDYTLTSRIGQSNWPQFGRHLATTWTPPGLEKLS